MKKKIISCSLFFLLFFGLFTFAAQAQTGDPTLNGLDQTAGKVGAFSSQIGKTYDATFFATKAGQLIGTLLAFIGVLFLILMIYAGLMWMTAGGNEQTVDKSKTLIINAIIGLVIVLAAYGITSFIGNNLIQ
jgi:lysylphosphatidylglycerol synthetase-like protein (DUF2156 family)